ncbi:MAG: Hsp20/alpha crystallin family protein [Planctomycetales bacterium]|nr:Hsp20/alpha crystallin family protein [Planctomycetales bacterium]
MITLDLPGMKPDDVAIELHEGRLTISGERQAEKAEPGETFHRLERPCGKFRRTFSLGPDVDSENVEAQYSDGVLRVTVAKSAKAQPRRINIKS